MVLIKEPKMFYFDFALPKYVDKDLKYEIEFIIKRNESLVEIKHVVALQNLSIYYTLKNIRLQY